MLPTSSTPAPKNATEAAVQDGNGMGGTLGSGGVAGGGGLAGGGV